MNKEPTPLAIFSYNRPYHLNRMFRSLARCNNLNDCKLYIFCDGPKNQDHISSVEASRLVAKTWADRLSANIIYRKDNWGLGRSIVDSVNDLCAKYESVIVLEDDFIVSPDFITYMLAALDQYKYNSNVYQIAGYIYPMQNPPQPEVFFLPIVTSRGWATWNRAWKNFDWNAPGYKEILADPERRRRFNLNNSFDYASELAFWMSEPQGPWSYRFYYAMFKSGGVTLFPRRSLVWVGGFDSTGANCGARPDFFQEMRLFYMRRRLHYPLRFPENAHIDTDAYQRLVNYFTKERQKNNSFYRKMRQRLHSYNNKFMRIMIKARYL